jgi:type VI secretion system secreted protein VgrG
MEQEGIYYYFRHEAGKHTAVLADSVGAHKKVPGYEEIPFYPPQEGERRERDHVEHWEAFHEIESSAFSFRDHDFTKPRAPLDVKRAGAGGGSVELERYDYPGGYVEASEGERYARTRLEEAAGRQEREEGAGNARGITPGMLFKLTEHPRSDQNREYLVVKASYELTQAEQETSASPSSEAVYRCSFTAQASSAPFRPECKTKPPVVRGPQTARVVGKAGEEIWTDSYGRVKVEFHWDRASSGDENSSCWVRVAQAWAGGSFGAIHIPRMGEEVVVSFLEGDPDRPLVTGHLYEADHMPPYPLPANQTRSGFLSRSTKEGGTDNANEIRIEDKKGEEQLYLQAEKNYDRLVKNDATYTIKHDETHAVDHDRKKTVGNDESTEVKANRTEKVGKDESITIDGNRTEKVAKNESIAIGGNRSETVDKDEQITISGNRTESVAKDESVSIQGGQTVSVTKDQSLTVSGGRTTSVSKDDALQVGKALVVSAADQIVLESGSARLVLKKDGTIHLEGQNITVEGSGKITIHASGDTVVRGANIKEN